MDLGMASVDMMGLTGEDAVVKMNQTLAMMEQQPNVVCQLFSAFTSAGVVPDVESYQRVITACLSQEILECAEMLLNAAEQQGLEARLVIAKCLEANPNPAFIMRWAPQALERGVPVPSVCFRVLLRDGAMHGGVAGAASCYQKLIKTGSREQEVAAALVQVCVELGKLEDLREVVGPGGLTDRALVAELAKAAAPTTLHAEMEAPIALPPGLSPPSGFLGMTPPRVPSPSAQGLRPSSPSDGAGEGSGAAVADALRAVAEARGTDAAYVAYIHALEVCVEASSIPEATMLVEEMRDSQVIDVAAFNILLKAHATKGRFDKAEKVFEDMRRAKVTPNAFSHNALLDAAARTGRYEKGWQLLGVMMRQSITADRFAVSLLLKNVTDKTDRNKSKRSLELVEKYIDLQRSDADDILFNSLLDACCRVRDIPRLERTLVKMRQFNVKPSPATFGTLLKAYGQRMDHLNVLRVWNDMKEAEIGINTVTYGCMLDACVKCGNYDKAEEVFSELKRSGLQKNTILYSTMIKCYSKQKKLRRAVKMMEEMQAENVPMNCVTYNSLIDAAIRCRDLQQATKFLEQMKAHSITPDLITYSTLIKGFCDQGDLDVAMNLLEHLKQQNMKCDEILYNSLLEGCVKSNHPQRGLDLFQEMLRDRVTVSNITFSIMVKLYASANRLDQALDLVKRMEPEFKIKPSNIVFSCLVKCCVTANRIPQAAALLLGLPIAAKIHPDQHMYALVLPGLIAQKHLDLAIDVFEALCMAPVSTEPGTTGRPPAVQALGVQLCEAVSGASTLQKEKARKALMNLRAARALGPEQEHVLASLLGPAQGWIGQEFVPSHGWDAANPYAQWGGHHAAVAHAHAHAAHVAQQYWGQWPEWSEVPQNAMTPMRKNRADENASPNVMEILLHSEVGSGEKAPRPRRVKANSKAPKTPVKMAPVVSAIDGRVQSPISSLALTPEKKERDEVES
jgi:pentatricopeptide repeat protein